MLSPSQEFDKLSILDLETLKSRHNPVETVIFIEKLSFSSSETDFSTSKNAQSASRMLGPSREFDKVSILGLETS